MEFKQLTIPEHLKGYIQSFWFLKDNLSKTSNKSLQSFKLIADGCPGLIFQHAAYGTFYQNKKKLPVTFLYGPSTKYSTLELDGQFYTIGMFFYPSAIKTVFGIDAHILTDNCVDLESIDKLIGKKLSEQLLNCTSVEAQVSQLITSITRLINQNEILPDVQVNYALKEIISSGGNISLKELRSKMNLSERTLERRFKTWIGVSPKLFTRICQFQSSIDQLKLNNYFKLSDIAFDNEFSDQSHFIRAFKEFSGITPNHYIRKSQSLVENLTQVSS